MTADQVVFWPGKPAWAREELVASLRRILKGRVDCAWLIGSYARGTADADSDVDLILVHSTSLPWPDRAREFDDLWDHFDEVDALVYTPEEWKRMEADPSPFLEHARTTWISLI